MTMTVLWLQPPLGVGSVPLRAGLRGVALARAREHSVSVTGKPCVQPRRRRLSELDSQREGLVAVGLFSRAPGERTWVGATSLVNS